MRYLTVLPHKYVKRITKKSCGEVKSYLEELVRRRCFVKEKIAGRKGLLSKAEVYWSNYEDVKKN